jgi:hypothetical protein
MVIQIRGLIKTTFIKGARILNEIALNITAVCSVFVQSDFFCKDIKKIAVRKSDEAVIVGNGPSLNDNFKTNINFFSGKSAFCVNDFAISGYFEVIKPDFYILFDSAYWLKNISKELGETNKRVFQLLKDKVSWPMTIIMPLSAKQWSWFKELPNLNKNIRICYVNWTRIDCSKSLRNFMYSRDLAMPRCANVLINAIFLAINMGYKKIFLAGADHSWHEDIFVGDDNVVYRKGEYCYSEGKVSLKPAFKNLEGTQVYKLHELFQLFSLTFKGHQEIEEYARFAGAKVYNISKKSYIDAYERVPLK